MDSSARSAVGAATPHRDGAAAGDGSRPSKRARVEGSSGGGSGSGCTAPQTVDYVGFYKHKVPNADRRYKNFCNLYKAPYVVPADGAALLPRIRGTTFQTVEGGFQLLKFDPTLITDDDIKLFAENSGAVAFCLGSSNASMFTANMVKKSNPELHAKMLAWKARKVPMRADWNVLKVGVMEEFMTYKYTQNKKLKTLLLSTGSKLIVERSPTDAVWGDGNQHKPELGPGTNLAGQLLVKIRDSILRK